MPQGMKQRGFYKKDQFLKEVQNLEISHREATPSDIKRWAIQYDLMAIGYDGNYLKDTTILLCSEEELIQPVESQEDIIARYERNIS